MTGKNAGGRPKVKWDEKERKLFEELCNIQCTQSEICRIMGVTDKTLSRLIRDNYGTGFAQVYKRFSEGGKASLRRSQFSLAGKNATMAIWLGKQYLDQRDVQEIKADTKVEFCFDDELSG